MLATVSMMACGSQVEVDKNEGEITTTTSATTTTVTTTVTTTNITTSEVTTENVTEESVSEAVNETGLSSAKTDSVEGSETILSEIITEKCEETTNSEPKNSEEYIVYKPSTKFLHRNSCRWNNGDAYRVDCTTELVARLCDECNPDVKDFIEFIPETVYCDPTDRDYLAQIVQHEAGSDWIGVYNKACVVAVVMNRVNSGNFPNTVYGVLTQPYQFSGFWFGYSPSQACYDAVDYYFSHTSEFSSSIMYFYGDGYQNYFY